MSDPTTEAGRSLLGHLRQAERDAATEADADEMNTFTRLAFRTVRDIYRELLRWVPPLVAAIEQEAASDPVRVSHASGHDEALCGPEESRCRCDCIACQTEHWEVMPAIA